MLKQNPNLINSILGLVSKALFTELLSARGFQFFNLPQLESVFCVIPWHICFPDSHLTFLAIKSRKRSCGPKIAYLLLTMLLRHRFVTQAPSSSSVPVLGGTSPQSHCQRASEQHKAKDRKQDS